MPRFGWKCGRWGYYIGSSGGDEKTYETIKKKAEDLLSKAKVGDKWTCRCGTEHIPILINDEIIGELWREIGLNGVKVGSYWSSPRGTKIQLVANNEVVGFMWVD